MSSRLIPIAVGSLLLGGAAVGFSSSSIQDPQDPNGADGPRVQRVQEPRGSLLLTVRVDARGVEVVQVTKKPQLEYLRKKIWDRSPFGWVMKNVAGEPIAEGGFHPGDLDLDPAKFGQDGQVVGDMLIPTSTHTNVKVPDLADFATIEFHQAGAQPRPFGTAQAAALTVR